MSASNHASLFVLCLAFMAISLRVDEDVPLAGGARGEQERGHAGVSGIEGLCAGRTMGSLQAQLLTFNSSLPVTPYRIASWKILVESQEQRKDVRLLLKETCSRGRGSPLVARAGRVSQRNLGSLKGWGQIWRHTPDGRAGEKGNAQEAVASPRSAALVHCLGMKCVCLCGKNSYADAVSLY